MTDIRTSVEGNRVAICTVYGYIVFGVIAEIVDAGLWVVLDAKDDRECYFAFNEIDWYVSIDETPLYARYNGV